MPRKISRWLTQKRIHIFCQDNPILKFRQGVGRLIRTKKDHGIVAILDNRVLTKRYGEHFLNALPSMEMETV